MIMHFPPPCNSNCVPFGCEGRSWGSNLAKISVALVCMDLLHVGELGLSKRHQQACFAGVTDGSTTSKGHPMLETGVEKRPAGSDLGGQ